MKSQLLSDDKQSKTFALVFDAEDDVQKQLLQFAVSHRIANAHLTAIGAFRGVTLGYFDRDKRQYKPIKIHEQVEVVGFNGNIVPDDGKPNLHAHVVAGKSDGTAHGGHFLDPTSS